jgi:hypothetical protein
MARNTVGTPTGEGWAADNYHSAYQPVPYSAPPCVSSRTSPGWRGRCTEGKREAHR